METLKDFLWPIVAIGGLGAFIDFLIGRTGQERTKEFLLKWWVRFDDVHWKNFGREEGLFAARLIERFFGRTIFNSRRLLAAVVVMLMSMSFGYTLAYLISIQPRIYLSSDGYIHTYCVLCIQIYNDLRHGYHPLSSEIEFQIPFQIMIPLASFFISASFTRIITVRMARLCGTGYTRNLIVFGIITVMNCMLLIFWAPAVSYFKESFIDNFVLGVGEVSEYGGYNEFFWRAFFSNLAQMIPKEISYILSRTYTKFGGEKYLTDGQVDNFSLYCLSLFSSFIRIVISIVFIGSFVLRPLVMRPINLVWARIIESDKPVFTLTFGGAAAFASAISEAAKHL